ncbi:MAG: hypothetical protein L3J09_07640 [Flavobacteriaceae bacterium]|nr:hypothetical protein [Flavobacteriaceae bacterium]
MFGKIIQVLINLTGGLLTFIAIIVVSGMYVSTISIEGLYKFALEVFIFGIIVFGLISIANFYFFKKRKKKPILNTVVVFLISLIIMTIWFLFNMPNIG